MHHIYVLKFSYVNTGIFHGMVSQCRNGESEVPSSNPYFRQSEKLSQVQLKMFQHQSLYCRAKYLKLYGRKPDVTMVQ